MVQKFKTKTQKHAYDDERRRESLKRKLKEQESQKQLIKKALSESDSAKHRKIVFDEDDDEIGGITENGNEGNINGNSHNEEQTVGKFSLFEESDNDEENNYEISVKKQFEGKKGQKLLNLQSNYNNDERFRLDERFHDDEVSEEEEEDDDDDDKDRKNSFNLEPNEIEEEKAKQLIVLESVLGQPVQPTSQKTEKNPKKSIYEMVRFDASNLDHKRQSGADESEVNDKSIQKKKKQDKKERKKNMIGESQKNEDGNKAKAEKKFYEISDDLKLALKNRKNETTHFSLLETFSKKLNDDSIDDDDDDDKEKEKGEEVVENDDMDEYNETWSKNENDEGDVNDSKYDKSNDEETGKSGEIGKVQGIKKEKFFFVDEDPRVEEGLKFINMKNSEEASEAIEKYDGTRKEIREVLRLRWQKHRQRKNPFRKKIGGSNKQKAPFNGNRKQYGKRFTPRRR